MAKLQGKTALVTGGSRGIGREIALRMAREGALLAVHCASREAAAAEVVQAIEREGGAAFVVRADLTRFEQIADMFSALRAELGRRNRQGIDILVNNAGVAVMGDIATTTGPEFDRVFAVNVRGTLFVTQHANDLLNDGGSVINLSSVVAQQGYPQFIAYAASKAAVDSMTKSMAVALAPRRIRVNCIAAGVVRTDMMARGLANEEFVADRLAVTALKAIGETDDIARVAVFLASEDANWITGERINVTGGMHL